MELQQRRCAARRARKFGLLNCCIRARHARRIFVGSRLPSRVGRGNRLQCVPKHVHTPAGKPPVSRRHLGWCLVESLPVHAYPYLAESSIEMMTLGSRKLTVPAALVPGRWPSHAAPARSRPGRAGLCEKRGAFYGHGCSSLASMVQCVKAGSAGLVWYTTLEAINLEFRWRRSAAPTMVSSRRERKPAR